MWDNRLKRSGTTHRMWTETTDTVAAGYSLCMPDAAGRKRIKQDGTVADDNDKDDKKAGPPSRP